MPFDIEPGPDLDDQTTGAKVRYHFDRLSSPPPAVADGWDK